jgi:hypothetical protein
MKKILFALLIVGLMAGSAFAEEWWQGAKDNLLEKADSKVVEATGGKLSLSDLGIMDKGASDAEYAAIKNWEHNYIQVVARGTADPRKALNVAHAKSLCETTARAIAYRKMAEEIYGVRVNSHMVLSNELLAGQGTHELVQGFIKRAKEVDLKWETEVDGSLTCYYTLGYMITGDEDSMMAQVLKLEMEQAANDPNRPKIWTPEPSKIPISQEKKYSGVVIDTRGLGLKPGLSPKIMTDAGELFYGSSLIKDQSFAGRNGVVYYSDSILAAQKRAGDKPLIIKALSVVGDVATDILIPGKALAELGVGIYESIVGGGNVAVLTD